MLYQTDTPQDTPHVVELLRVCKQQSGSVELQEDSVIRKFRTTAADGKSYKVTNYNLDVIITIGYRAIAHRGT